MSDKHKLNPVAATIGTTFAVSLAAAPIASAADNPFSLTEFSSGYQIAEGKCGEGKCGGEKSAEGKCGEGKCGGHDMEGNAVDLPDNFTYGGDNMGQYAGNKIGTGAKDPSVCGTFSGSTCSMPHLKK